MIKNQITIGSAITLAGLNFAEKVDKTTEFGDACTHINVLIPITEKKFKAKDDTDEIVPILIHAGTAVKRYKCFDRAKIVPNPVISAIFFSQE